MGEDDPDFYVIEDLWHPHQSYIVVWCDIAALSPELVDDLWALHCVQRDWIVRLQLTHLGKAQGMEVILMKKGFLTDGWSIRGGNTIADLFSAAARHRASAVTRRMHKAMNWLTGWRIGKEE
jgi:hypothetical protein